MSSCHYVSGYDGFITTTLCLDFSLRKAGHMPAVVGLSNENVEDCLRQILQGEGYALSPKKTRGETGVDILATKDSQQYHIEVIGFKSSPSARAYDFYQIFFRAVSRLNQDAKHCIIGLPKRFEDGLPARASQHRTAWERIGRAFPELEIWLIDTDAKMYRRTSWMSWTQEEISPERRDELGGRLPVGPN